MISDNHWAGGEKRVPSFFVVSILIKSCRTWVCVVQVKKETTDEDWKQDEEVHIKNVEGGPRKLEGFLEHPRLPSIRFSASTLHSLLRETSQFYITHNLPQQFFKIMISKISLKLEKADRKTYVAQKELRLNFSFPTVFIAELLIQNAEHSPFESNLLLVFVSILWPPVVKLKLSF